MTTDMHIGSTALRIVAIYSLRTILAMAERMRWCFRSLCLNILIASLLSLWRVGVIFLCIAEYSSIYVRKIHTSCSFLRVLIIQGLT
jgi:hypothetical protein